MPKLMKNDIPVGKMYRNGVPYFGGTSSGSTPSTEWYGDNILVADEGGDYITTPLNKEIPAGTTLLISIKDSTYPITDYAVRVFDGTSLTISMHGSSPITSESYTLSLTSTTAGLSHYTGAYRKVYAKISSIDDEQLYTTDET